jgi:alkylation response protein AidB-like acyl-CoA dehydrogenase
MVEECIFLEETCRGLAPIHAYSTAMTAGATYLRWGTEEQKRETMGGICRGRLEAIALSEPGAGSDLGGVRCRARRDGDAYVIDGQKTWISAAHQADHILALVRTDSNGNKHQGLTLDNVVGEEGKAWKQLMRGLSIERLIIAAMSLGAAERSLEDTIAYVTEREQFGRRISSFQALRHRIADVATEVACCKALVYDVAEKIDVGQEDRLSTESSMAKLKCTQVAKEAALEGMQMMGGYGYAVEYGMEQQVRAALAPPIYGGSNEIQREIIGKNLGL